MSELEYKYDFDIRKGPRIVLEDKVQGDKSIFALAEELTIKYGNEADSIYIYRRDSNGSIDLSLRLIFGT